MIKYCDRCKFNTLHNSKAIQEAKNEETIEICPLCGEELFKAENYDEIP